MLCSKYLMCRETFVGDINGEAIVMTMVTQDAIEQGYKKMQHLPQEKLVLLLGIIDQFYNIPRSSSSVKLGIADGKYTIPENINEYDDEIAELFGVLP